MYNQYISINPTLRFRLDLRVVFWKWKSNDHNLCDLCEHELSCSFRVFNGFFFCFFVLKQLSSKDLESLTRICLFFFFTCCTRRRTKCLSLLWHFLGGILKFLLYLFNLYEDSLHPRISASTYLNIILNITNITLVTKNVILP